MESPMITPTWSTTPLWTFSTLTLAVGSAYVATVLSKRLNTPNTYRLIRENDLDMYTLGTLWGLEPCLYIQTACWSGLRFVQYINEISQNDPDARWYHPTNVFKLSSAFLPAFVHNVFRSVYSPSIMKIVTNHVHELLIQNAYQTVRNQIGIEQVTLRKVLNDIEEMPFPREINEIICEFAAPNSLFEKEIDYWREMHKAPSDNTKQRWNDFTETTYFKKVLPVGVMGVMCSQFIYSMFASANVGAWNDEPFPELEDATVEDFQNFDVLLGREMSGIEQLGVRALLVADVGGFIVCSYFLVKYHWDDLVRLVD